MRYVGDQVVVQYPEPHVFTPAQVRELLEVAARELEDRSRAVEELEDLAEEVAGDS